MYRPIKYGSVVSGSEVVSLDTAKANSNITSDHEDDLLTKMLEASVRDAEQYISSPLLERNMLMSLPKWGRNIVIPVSPVQTFTRVNYWDENGNKQELASSGYRFDADTGQLIFSVDKFPDLEEFNLYPISLEFVAGYKNGAMPEEAVSAVLMRFSHKEHFREDVPSNFKRAFFDALRPLRRW
nr:phage head-tail connector protein [Allomuricauda sp.]